MQKKLYRSRKDTKISGICGGLAEYFSVDSTLIRLLWAVCTVFSGIVPGIILYIVCVIIIPEDPGYLEGDYQERP